MVKDRMAEMPEKIETLMLQLGLQLQDSCHWYSGVWSTEVLSIEQEDVQRSSILSSS